ncbi:alpha-1,3-galactosidase-related protein [Sphingobacterium lumbrici]|uniref:alpha-1,3-galactosidase-related protein n=1 Tax=Sphingobacterium lumbrici TaxID=2559600 RepID=UPI00112E6FDA|nr:right-handed parallel beta-helix repeat-containing protein [Sphingobacterium lumbrici]
MNTYLQRLALTLCCCLVSATAWCSDTLLINSHSSNVHQQLEESLRLVKSRKGKPTVLKFETRQYEFYREHTVQKPYFVSNTTNKNHNPSAIKHIAIYIKGIKNLTIDGGNSLFMTHGKMTSFFIDSCENIVLKNFSIDAVDPTVVEAEVLEATSTYLVLKPHSSAKYTIQNNRIIWSGHQWQFEGGIAQIYDPNLNTSDRCTSPMSGIQKIENRQDGTLKIWYEKAPHVRAGQVYQLRDGFRDEVVGSILKSKNIILENINLHFLGNFGIVGQYSENITLSNLNCEPALNSGRTCAGFADFVQMSGCKGLIQIENCRFEGAQDDPINIHGTHLKIDEFISDKQIKVSFRHPESYGFEAFFKGDKIEIVDSESLTALKEFAVKQVNKISQTEIILTLDKSISPELRERKALVVENITWTPHVSIRNCYFARIPTRGILVTTRKPVEISHNVFFRTPMSAILIANDARSWYESGPVHQVRIHDNQFIECGEPVIYINPESSKLEKYVHRDIAIFNNRFVLKNQTAVYAKSVEGLHIYNNLISKPKADVQSIATKDCIDVTIEGNQEIIKQ